MLSLANVLLRCINMYDSGNIFAKIVRREIPSTIVYEDAYVLSIKDIRPLAQVHVLVITKGAYENFDDFICKASDEEKLGYFAGIDHTIDALGLKKTGYRLMMNTGKDAHQEVQQLHTHILGGQDLGLPEKID